MSEPQAAAHPHHDYEKGLSGSSTQVASFDTHDKTPLQRFQHFLHSSPAAVPLIVLVFSLLVFGIVLGGKFFSAFTLTLILQQVAIVGIVGAAQTLVILTAGIDLSVGAIMVLSSVVMGQFTFRYGLPPTVAIACGFAVGDDPEAAELAGVNVKRMLIGVYTLSGLICALAGWALIGRIGSVSPTAGQFANIESITAVVIGGMSLFGGRGSILGMLFGALIVGVFSLGLRLIGTDPQWTYLLIGVLIISAVAIDQWIRKVAG